MTSDPVGGVLTYTAELIRGLGQEAEVVLATMGRPLREDQRAELLAAGAAQVHDGGYALEWMPDPWDEVQAAGAWLLELESRLAPDLVHLNGYAHAALPWRVPCVVVGHSCVLSWWRAVHGTAAPGAWDRYRSVVADGLHAADAVVAPTATMLTELRDLYGRWPGEATVIHNGSSLRLGPQAPAKEPLVLAAGRLWDEAKNLIALEFAAAGLVWPVLVAGALNSPDGVRAQTENVRALGELSREQLACLRRRAAVFAAPARYEPFGLAVLEAALDGCALVLGDIPSLRELWDGVARFVAPSDHRALHRTLRELALDRPQRQQLADAAQWRARRYRSDAMGCAYGELYRRLLVRTGVPA